MTNVEEALSAARRYVAEHRPRCRVAGLLQDSEDFLVRLETDAPEFPVGWEIIFVKKSTGKIWTAAPGEAFDKMDEMVPV